MSDIRTLFPKCSILCIQMQDVKNQKIVVFISRTLRFFTPEKSKYSYISATRQIYSKSSEVLLFMEENAESNKFDGPTSEEIGCSS